jgi:glycyl-tRNA synthetase
MDLQELVSLAKRRGFIFQSSEIYGGLNGCWDYGPLGVELKRNIKELWWKTYVGLRDDMVGLDSSILMASRVWDASGHTSVFTDPLVDCKKCRGRFRADQLKDTSCPEKPSKKVGEHDGCQLTEPRAFNLMFQTQIGAMADAGSVTYLRPETAQGIFVNFKSIVETSRMKIPFGVAQVGKSFRNEINPRNFTFRTREFEQMEIEFFCHPAEAPGWYDYWRKERYDWYLRLGMKKEHLHLREYDKGELAHYSQATCDIEYDFPFGRGELEGVANRTDYDLKQHTQFSGKDLRYFDAEKNEKYVPYVIEPSAGADRSTLAFLCDAYHEDEVEGEKRVVLRFHPRLSPVKAAILPLLKKPEQMELAEKLYHDLKRNMVCDFDSSGSIGKRYRRQDEVGTPFCVTVDPQTLEDQCVTVRMRDSTKQERLSLTKIGAWLNEHLNKDSLDPLTKNG